MIQHFENQETSRPGTMVSVPITPLVQWRFGRDISPVHYHAPARRAGRLRAAPSGDLRDGQPHHRRVDRPLRGWTDPFGPSPDPSTAQPVLARPLPRCFEPASEADASFHRGADEGNDQVRRKPSDAGSWAPGPSPTPGSSPRATSPPSRRPRSSSPGCCSPARPPSSTAATSARENVT